MTHTWQPIETAPKDGTEILTVGTDSKNVIATKWLSPGPFHRGQNGSYYAPDGWYWAGWDAAVGPVNPTHWMHLPDPPENAE
jgi:hypothetical protein